MMSSRNFQRERKLFNDWQYFRPRGPHIGENVAADNLEEMSDADVERLMEIGDEMADYIKGL